MDLVKKVILITLISFGLCYLNAEIVQIGFDNMLNQCLPVEPMMNYSYSQSIYTPDEIESGGVISAIGFQYRINGNTFLSYTNQFSIYLGSVQRDEFHSITDWVPLDSLQLVFEGSLQPEWFSTELPGQGWLMIPLAVAYNYSGTANLVVAVDENMPGSSSMGDDFYCSVSEKPLSIELHSNAVNPEPLNPPAAFPGNPLSIRPNLRLDIQPVVFTPNCPSPAEAATDVPLNPTLSWQSNADSWDILFAPANQTLQTAASDLTSCEWSPSAQLALLTEYHWQVIAHLGDDDYPGPVWSFTSMGEDLTAPQNLQAMTIGMQVRLDWQAPITGNIQSYRIYRNQQFISEIQELQYYDSDVLPNLIYWYQVAAVNYLNQVSPLSNSVSVTIPGSPPVWQMNFDDQPDFAISILNWTMYDLDHSLTWSWQNTNFPHEGSAMSWIVFSPSQTTPPAAEVTPHNGQKLLLCPDSTNPPNNDWLISPAIAIENGYELSFWARSYSADYGLERIRFLISTTNTSTNSFLPLSIEPWQSIPAEWTEYTYDLSAYTGHQIYLAWQCVSWDAFALCLDDILITSTVSNEDETNTPKPEFAIYPNPAKDKFTIESKDNTPFEVSIYNIKGQLISKSKATKSLEWKGDLKSGLYIVKIVSSKGSTEFKVAILR